MAGSIRSLSLLAVAVLLLISVTAAEDAKFAFVTTYYAGGKLSKSDFIAIRTMYKSFLSVNSIADFIVFTGHDTPSYDIEVLKKDGMNVSVIDMENAYKQRSIPVDYQKTKNLLHLWDVQGYKRLIFVDLYTIFAHNFDGLFDCSYLCLKDEQPLVYSNDMIVLTPGHAESRKIFEDCLNGRATVEQYTKFNHYGYYSTELYEISQAAPVFELGDKEANDQVIRRYYNYMNFPSIMWYEKFNWNLYSCSKLDDKSMPVYSINFRYTLGHRNYFLPTYWQGHHFVFILNGFWYSWREKVAESFFASFVQSAVLIVVCVIASPWIVKLLSSALTSVLRTTLDLMKRTHCETAIMKLFSAGMVGFTYVLGFWLTPYWYRPAAGFTVFAVFFTIFNCALLLAFNKTANVINGEKRSASLQMKILFVANALMLGSCVLPFGNQLPVATRVASLVVHFFVVLYCVYSQISPVVWKSKIIYAALPE